VNTVAVAMVCKTPIAGQSKTRLTPLLSPEDCAKLSACFIRDVAATIKSLCADGDATGYAVYTPQGSEPALRPLLPAGFRLMLQGGGGLGERLIKATADLFRAGHAGVVLVNSDSPTLPQAILRAAVNAVRHGDPVVLSPALDGGYTLIGLSQPHPEIFAGIPWSTSEVYRVTVARARELAMTVTNVPSWYDVDDLASLRVLEAELSGEAPPCAAPGIAGGDAPATRRFLATHRAMLPREAR
jgi:rSAM/selenodomain-associated transferase 1